jgi:hypothetical protein
LWFVSHFRRSDVFLASGLLNRYLVYDITIRWELLKVILTKCDKAAIARVVL